jgi:hypothetical protein
MHLADGAKRESSGDSREMILAFPVQSGEVMKIDRLSFLALAASLSAAACSSASNNAAGDEDEGALERARRCLSPGGDEPISTTALRTCDELAKRGEAVGEDAASLRLLCSAFLTNFKANAAAEAKKCLDGIRPVGGGRDKMIDWEAVYSCGFDILASSCPSSDVNQDCEEILSQPKPSARVTHDSKEDAASLRAECVGFMSGLKPAARKPVKTCAMGGGDYAVPLYACVEGLDPNDRAVCIDGNARPRTPEGAVLSRGENAYQCYFLPGPEAEGICIQFTEAARVGVGAEIAKRMQAVPKVTSPEPRSTEYLDRLYASGVATLRATCGSDSVNEPCKALVAKYTEAGMSNAGGRLTRECRDLFPGLLKSARDHVLASPVPADGKIASALVKLPSVPPTELPPDDGN